ncbi:MAG: (2Fe-2S)-binding protein [Pseudomonadota bacterium]|nr:(2Fe-2S)-binding protein [Gammaproteobacteria bacterium]MEE2683721.1 (2Fe-2S)-binding protein [Pseudomonadota bacterium]|tara:strand:- start:1759 stop:2220 length:462 start_codon:yes stop_codon:yes gene_type:complete
MAIELKINGDLKAIDAEPSTPLLYILRQDLELNGPKFGCGVAQCGACTVLVDKQPIRACVTPISALIGRDITTLEGLGNEDSPHPLQTAFIEEQAAQCGFCSNGMIMSAAALLENNPNPTDQEIKDSLNANLCRCGTHTRILKAVKKAAGNHS